MNTTEMVQANTAPERDIDTITTEICVIKDQAQRILLAAAIEIGRRLTEVKALIPHGEWGNYLKEKVEFSQSTANNMMRVAKEYGDQQISLFSTSANSQAFANLSYTQALKLLALPEDERVEFAEQNDVENMSTRELDKAIREREMAIQAKAKAEEQAEIASKEKLLLQSKADAAEKRAEDATAKVDELNSQLETMKADLEKKAAAAKKAKDKLKELQENPEVPPEVMERIRKEAEEAAAKEADAKAQETLSAIEAEKQSAERAAATAKQEAERAAQKLEAMEKQIKMANPEVAVFKMCFEQVQEAWNKMQGALLKVQANDPAIAENLQKAVSVLVKKWGEQV